MYAFRAAGRENGAGNMQNFQRSTTFCLPAIRREKESGDAQLCTCIASINASTWDWPPYHAVQTLASTMKKSCQNLTRRTSRSMAFVAGCLWWRESIGRAFESLLLVGENDKAGTPLIACRGENQSRSTRLVDRGGTNY